MTVDGLSVPQKIEQLIIQGVWPQEESQELKQHAKSIVSPELLGRVCKNERKIYFYRPPFMTLKKRIDLGDEVESFQLEDGSKIDPELLVILGDFGIGSDAFLGLYYRDKSDTAPLVVKEEWDDSKSPTSYVGWIKVSQSFSEFCKLLGLDKT